MGQIRLSDLLKAAKAADADQAAKARALAAASSDKAHADTTVTETHQSFASAVKSKGGIFVDTSATPLMQFTSNPDGSDYTPLVVAGPDDTVDVPDVEPTPPPPPGPEAPAIVPPEATPLIPLDQPAS